MKVLWFSITPGLYEGTASPVGGWVASLQRIVAGVPEIELAVAFEYGKEAQKVVKDGFTYYPMYRKRSRFQERYIDSYTTKHQDAFAVAEGLRIIEDFKPDLIQVFGSEWPFGLLAEHTQVPIVIHMQGMWPAYRNVNLSQTATRTLWDVMHETWKPQLWWSFLRKQHLSKERALREEKILSINKNFMGRTRWDKALTQLYAPEARYFYCSEALRDSFVHNAKPWNLNTDRKKCVISTVGNWDMIKGYDLVLQTAQLLKDHGFDFEWRLIGAGADAIEILRRKLGIVAADVNVQLLGTRTSNEIVDLLLDSDMFLQTSWIDNSPNAVCEAQYLGLPIITTYTGGVPSLFAEGYDRDLMVPLHDPYYLASKIIELFNNKERMAQLGEMNYETAHQRHKDDSIRQDLLACYKGLV